MNPKTEKPHDGIFSQNPRLHSQSGRPHKLKIYSSKPQYIIIFSNIQIT
ncbi:TetR family transcriptional regulator [Leptospira santarosai]|uniref:TetR family transcriptional regulator n=1 Tax=Leptospira santarosai TaxID=28183 RepID=A0AB73LNF2_9LEPT|nr:TetR family transcriptional regulator [Leptospira santarosai serovar Guaricura]ONF93673.1 TetR family transcriptional regulator [Leptospira santarosai]